MKRIVVSVAFMAISAISLFIAFTLVRSAFLGFILYYLVACLGLPALDLVAVRTLAPRAVPEALGLRGSRRGIAVGVATGFGMAAIMLIVLIAFSERLFGDGKMLAVVAGWGVSSRNAFIVYVVMLAFNGAVEELFWRGFLYDGLKAVSSRVVALGLPLLFFSAQHYFVVSRLVTDPGLVALILAGIFGAGLVWSVLREATRSVVPCVISHTIVTAGYMGAFYFFTNLGV